MYPILSFHKICLIFYSLLEFLYCKQKLYFVQQMLLASSFLFLRYIVVIIHVAGFQTVAIFMQTGELEKSTAAIASIDDIVKDSPHKVCTIILLTDFFVYFNSQLARSFLVLWHEQKAMIFISSFSYFYFFIQLWQFSVCMCFQWKSRNSLLMTLADEQKFFFVSLTSFLF